MLIAGAVTTLGRPFTRKILDLGVAQDIDAYSFHYYEGCSGKSPEETFVFREIDCVRSLKNREGQPMKVWHTEGSATGPSCLDGMCMGPADSTSVGDYATILVRSAAAFKAIGVQKYFHYDANAHPAGAISYRRLTDMMDVNGIPQPSLAAHAAMVYFLEEAEPAGLQRLANDAVTVAGFNRHGKRIDVVWAKPETSIESVKELNYKNRLACDIMGNPISVSPQTILTTKPIYLLDK
jgi:hypothetical protein